MEKRIRCYTIGYGNRTVDEFVGLLQEKGITHLVDIRRFPHSWKEEFDKESIEKWLPSYTIAYFHCSGVGGMRESSYVDDMKTEEFKQSFSLLLKRIIEVNELGGNIVLMCAEKRPDECHRYHLSIELEKNNVEMEHLTESGQTSLFSY